MRGGLVSGYEKDRDLFAVLKFKKGKVKRCKLHSMQERLDKVSGTAPTTETHGAGLVMGSSQRPIFARSLLIRVTQTLFMQVPRTVSSEQTTLLNRGTTFQVPWMGGKSGQ